MPRHQTSTGDSTTSRKLLYPCLVLLIMILVVSCSSSSPPAPQETVHELSWSRIALPDSVAASSLVPTSGNLLVGGRASAGGDHPVLFTVNASNTTRPVSLHPISPYAKVADIASLARDGSRPDEAREGRRFLAIGRLAPQKNFPLLVRAFARIAGPGDRLAILGEGPERARLERLADRLGVAGGLLLPGHVEDTRPWLAGADTFVLSSDYEGLPAVVLEAFAAGLPVVATRCAASLPVLIDEGRTGRLVPVGDAAALAAAMAPPMAFDRARARATVDRFTVERAAPAYLDLFRELVARRTRLRFPATHGVS